MEESKILKILKSEIGVVISIASFLLVVLVPYYSIKIDIALIQKDISIININHEQHIQDILNELTKIKEDEVTLEKDLAITNQTLIDHINK